MADFTHKQYQDLLKALIEQKYSFQTLADYMDKPKPRTVILRHDVDKRPGNSLCMAQLESDLGLSGVYYFRARPQSWDEQIIIKIRDLGHEIGYHYENMWTCKGKPEAAIKDFERNLKKLRKLADVSTITMHGSPTSKYAPLDLWNTYDYRVYDIICEPYKDLDFSRILYLSDTGRRWDGEKVSIRDRVPNPLKDELSKNGHTLHSSRQLIRTISSGLFPDTIMFNLHPQRWHNNALHWFSELLMQNAKNVVKRMIVRKRQ